MCCKVCYVSEQKAFPIKYKVMCNVKCVMFLCKSAFPVIYKGFIAVYIKIRSVCKKVILSHFQGVEVVNVFLPACITPLN